MLRPLGWLLTIGLVVLSAHTEVSACGDKFLRVGRSARFRRYASVHPSAILVYGPRWTAIGIDEFEKMLKRAGHRPATVTTPAALLEALTAAKYDVVITSYTDSGSTREMLHTANSRAAVLPVLYKPAKDEEAVAVATYQHLLRPEKMTPFQALEELDRLIDQQLKAAAPAASTP